VRSARPGYHQHGVTIAFAMECVERGFLTERQIGMPLRWAIIGRSIA